MKERQKELKDRLLVLQGALILPILLYQSFSNILTGGILLFTFWITLIGYEMVGEYFQSKTYPGPFLVEQWKRWVRPVLPVLCISALFQGIFFWDTFPLFRGEGLSGFFMVQNGFQVFGGLSYLKQNVTTLVSHLWFPSLVFQMLILWSLFLFGKKTKQKQINVLFFQLVIMVLSVIILMISYFFVGEKMSLFMRVDTQIFAFSWGVILGAYGYLQRNKEFGNVLDMIAGTLIALFLFTLFILNGNHSVHFFLSILVIFLNGILLFSIVKEKNLIANVITMEWVMSLGKRAYLLFLWSYPVKILVEKIPFLASVSNIVGVILSLLLTFFVVEVIYRLSIRSKGRIYLVLAILFIGMQGYSFATQKPMARGKETVPIKQSNTSEKKEEEQEDLIEEIEPYQIPKEIEASVEQINARQPNYRLNLLDMENLSKQVGVFIGDDSLVQNEAEYKYYMPKMIYNGKNGRQFYEIVDLVKNTADNMAEDNTPIVLHLGENSDFDISTLQEIVKVADGQRILLVNIVSDNPWVDSFNQKLETVANQNQNVFLVDWYSLANSQGDLFDSETGETKESGKRMKAQMIGKMILTSSIEPKEETGKKIKE